MLLHQKQQNQKSNRKNTVALYILKKQTKTALVKTTTSQARCVEKFDLCVLQHTFSCEKRPNFCQCSLRSPVCYLMRVFGLDLKKRSKTKSRGYCLGFSFCGSPFWT